jgi:hypothetical protein
MIVPNEVGLLITDGKMSAVRQNVWYLIGRILFGVLWVGAVGVLTLAYAGTSVPSLDLWGVLILGAMASVVPHELGHALACWAVGAEVQALRQAGPGGQAEAERLGERALPGAGPDDDLRLSLFAVVVASRQARGMPYEDVLVRVTEGLPAETGSEVEYRAAEFRAIADPAGFLAAFRAAPPAPAWDPYRWPRCSGARAGAPSWWSSTGASRCPAAAMRTIR